MRLLATTLFLLVLGMSSAAFGYGLSPTFGTDGLVTTDVGAPSEARGIVVQPDGKIVAAGTANRQPVLVRYLANGDLDPDFGTGGIASIATPYPVVTWRLVRQPDGKLLITGAVGGKLFAARVNDDGSPDASFGTDGVVAATVSGGFAVTFGLALEPGGTVLLGGKLDGALSLRTAIFRLLADGAIDASFGSGGIATADRGASTEYAYDLALLADGKILAGGDTASKSGQRAFSLLRFLADGTLDPTFGEDGGVTSRFASDQSARAMTVQGDGKILLAGTVDNGGHGGDAVVARYLPDGALDPSFGDGGLVTLDFNGRGAGATGLALQFDGSIMVGGQVNDVGDEHYLGGGVARLKPDGSLDRSWGVCGTVISENSVYGIAVEPDWSVMAAGYYEGDIAVARFAANPQPFCPPAPLSGCKSPVAPRSGKLTIKSAGVAAKDQIAWQWRRGAATSAADLGDPATAEDDYTFCVYDASTMAPQLVYGARIPAGGGCAGRACWQASTDGFKYADKNGTPCGVAGLDLRAGPDGKARFTLKAKGVHVGAPTLPLPLPLRLQLERADGPCWEATFSAPGVRANAGANFKAIAD